jgi:hypothetical protein
MSVPTPFSSSSLVVMFTIFIHVQILKTQTILRISHSTHIRQIILLANLSSLIQAPPNGACFTLFIFCSHMSMASGNALHRVPCGDTLHSPLQHLCRAVYHTLKHDQTCIRSKRLMFDVSCLLVSTSFLPWFPCGPHRYNTPH